MDTLQLKYFRTVAKYENISKAAIELNITQPALSLTIKRLEATIGYPLFKRVGKNIYLNDFGKIFLDTANLIIIELENLNLKFEKINNIKNKKFSISSTSSLFLIGLLKNFLDENPDIKVVQTINNRPTVISQLKYGEIDVAITSPPISEDNIKTIILADEEIVLLVNKQHKLANKNFIDIDEIKDENFMELTQSFSFIESLKEFYKRTGFSPNVIFEGDMNIVKDLLTANKGVTLAPASLIKTFESSNIKCIHLNSEFNKRTIALSYLDISYKSDTLKSFISFTKKHFLGKTSLNIK
ncbi:MAG: LysR family transcriptional regulator [Sarcina sp.]